VELGNWPMKIQFGVNQQQGFTCAVPRVPPGFSPEQSVDSLRQEQWACPLLPFAGQQTPPPNAIQPTRCEASSLNNHHHLTLHRLRVSIRPLQPNLSSPARELLFHPSNPSDTKAMRSLPPWSEEQQQIVISTPSSVNSTQRSWHPGGVHHANQAIAHRHPHTHVGSTLLCTRALAQAQWWRTTSHGSPMVASSVTWLNGLYPKRMDG